jgi:hypothetical protein
MLESHFVMDNKIFKGLPSAQNARPVIPNDLEIDRQAFDSSPHFNHEP